MKAILDTDLNFPSDDFQAMLLLLADPTIDVLGYCATAGNTWSEEVESNLHDALRFAGRPETRILAGADFKRFSKSHAMMHQLGKDGLRSFFGAYEKSDRPRSWITRQDLAHGSAPRFMVDVASRHPDEIRLICIGPLTNVRDALEIDPGFADRVGQAYVMGGNFDIRPQYAEQSDFNVWFDPESAQTVFNSGLRIMLLPLDVCRAAAANRELIDALCLHTRQLGGLFVDDFLGMVAQHGEMMPLCDQLLAIIVRKPDLVTNVQRGHVEVDCRRSATRGRTVFHPSQDGPVQLIRTIDTATAHSELLKYVDLMQRFPCPAFPLLGTPRFQYLIQNQLCRSPVWLCEFLCDRRTIQVQEPRLIRDIAEFTSSAVGVMELLMRASNQADPCHSNGLVFVDKTKSRFHRKKRLEQLIFEEMACAHAIFAAKHVDGDWYGVQCLGDHARRGNERNDQLHASGLTVIEERWHDHKVVTAMAQGAREWRRRHALCD